MGKKKLVSNVYNPISECRICTKLLNRQEISEDFNAAFPKESNDLQKISPTISKCPICSTYYQLSYYDFCPDPLEIPVRTYKKLVRCSLAMIKDVLNDPNSNIEIREKLNNEWIEFEKKQEEITETLTTIIKTQHINLNWQIIKYIIEFLTDYYLITKDWAKFNDILLKNENSVVRVQAAYDILILATEPNTGKRYFTKEIQMLARNLLFRNKIKNCLKLIHIFTNSLDDESETYEISLIGYKRIPLNHLAYKGLNNASYRGFDITVAIPYIVTWLSEEDLWHRENGYYLLNELLKRNEEYSYVIRKEIKAIEKRNKEMTKILRLCKIPKRN